MPDKSGVYHLIKSLNKAEKRHFKLTYSDYGKQISKNYIRLFEALDKMNKYDEDKLSDELSDLSSRQIINAKRDLYDHLLRSLRQFNIKHRSDILISERIDHARILYSKGLYLASLKILDKILPLAVKSGSSVLQLEIMEFEKFIEARHITRSRRVVNKVEQLIERSQTMGEELLTSVQLSNWSLQIHGYYIQNGFVKSDKDVARIHAYFKETTPRIEASSLSNSDKIFFQQAFMWYRYILQDVKGTYKHAAMWVAICNEDERMKIKDPDPYLRGMHYLLLSCFYAEDVVRYRSHYRTFAHFIKRHHQGFTVTTAMLAFIYHNNARLNRHLLTGDYKKALSYKQEILDGIERFQGQLDHHRTLIFYYKIAWLHFGRGQYDEALEMLNQIIHMNTSHLRMDLRCYALLLHLICHVKLNHTGLAQYLLRSTKRAFANSPHESSIITATLEFIQEWIKHPNTYKQIAPHYATQIESIGRASIDRRSMTYFNFFFWSRSLTENTTVERIARKIHAQR